MTDIVEELENTWVGTNKGSILYEAKVEILRLRGQLEAADEHAKRLEAVVEKMKIWEEDISEVLG